MFRDNMRIIKNYFRLVKGKRTWFYVLFFSTLCAHLLSLLFPIFSADIILFLTEKNSSKTFLAIVFLALSYICYRFMRYIKNVSYANYFVTSYRSVRKSIMNKIMNYDIEFSNKISKSTILNTVNTDTAALAEMSSVICEIIIIFVKVIILSIVFLRISILLGIFVLLMQLCYLAMSDWCNRMCASYLMKQQRQRDKLTDVLQQSLNGLSEVKGFHLEEAMNHKFDITCNKWEKIYRTKHKYMDLQSLIPLMRDVTLILLYIILAYFVLIGRYEIDILVLFISYFKTMSADSGTLITYSRQIRNREVSLIRIENLLNYNQKSMINFGNYNLDKIKGTVIFKHVTFSYKSKNKGSIHDISFQANPHQITAIVGKSGSGKTTITNLLLRRYVPDSGIITIDDEDITSYSKEVYAKNVVGVNQSPFLFPMSIRKNLSLIDSNIEHQISVCKRVGLHDYIMGLPDQYNTVLSENGTNFSGGQRQLFAIARTLLSKAEILIFDEVTSSLDTGLVEEIKNIFQDLKKDHTILIITHKKDVMKIADQIVVLNNGNIVGIGTHQELMKNNKYYIEIQNSESYSSKKDEQPLINQEEEKNIEDLY